MLDGNQYIDYWETNKAVDNMVDENGIKLYPNGLSRPARVDSAMQNPDEYLYSTDWFDEIFRMGSISGSNLAISSGTEKSSAFFSVDHKNNKGIQLGSGYKETSLQLNSNYNIGMLTLGENVNIYTTERLNNGSRVRQALRQSPLLPVYNDTATSDIDKYAGNTNLDNSNNGNPVADILGKSEESTKEAVQGKLFAELQLLKQLNLTTNYMVKYDAWNEFSTTFKRKEGTTGPNIPQVLGSHKGDRYFATIFESILTYKQSFGGHNVTAMAGYTKEDSKKRRFEMSANKFSVSNPLSMGSRADDAPLNISGGYEYPALQSGLGRIMYDYKSKYLFTANYRIDGTSAFQKGHKWSEFPSFSAGWRVSEEPFMDPLVWLDNLKIRAGYGKLGSQHLPDGSNEKNLLASATYILNNQIALGKTDDNFIDANLTWETTITKGIGIDAEMLNNKLEATVDYFHKKNEGMILGVPLPYSSGSKFTDLKVYTNAGHLVNKGWEFTLTARKYSGELTADATLALTIEDTEVTSLDKAENLVGGTTQYFRGGITNTEVGFGIGDFYGYVFDGIYQIGDKDIPVNKQPGDVRYKDINGDGLISAEDRTRLGKSVPDLTYSLNINLNYKGIDLSMFLVGVYGNQIFNHNKYHTQTLSKAFNQSVDVLNAWTPDNPSNTMPRYTDQHTDNYSLASSRYIENGSYARLQNITLGYTLPKNITDKIKAGQLRVYGTIQNVFTIASYSGIDPEIYSSEILDRGIDDGIYPLARTIAIGLELGF
ncbi:MAG: SusC/RagA family TonB-linked outer membrane protein [Bacteroidales bacterium]|nr:SusC/RagA family TonB-linked outer membrane protein [Bacteroidales bacterium]